jgi:hypothetical protein
MKRGGTAYRIVYPPEVVTNDPALRALLAMGSRALPTLEKTLNEPPHDSIIQSPIDPIQRVKSWTGEKWQQWHGGGAGAPIPLDYGSVSRHGWRRPGWPCSPLAPITMRGRCVCSRLKRLRGQRVTGLPRWNAFTVANAGLPERHKEIVAGIVTGLNHTNPQIQLIACNGDAVFSNKFARMEK